MRGDFFLKIASKLISITINLINCFYILNSLYSIARLSIYME